MKKLYPLLILPLLVFVTLFSLIGCSSNHVLSRLRVPENTFPVVKPDRVLLGKASWYGVPFHGRKTANGEVYNMYSLTAAHKTLPFGSLLKVTNLANQKELIVRVNDRGPYVGDRILDLSFAAAQKLGMIHQGVAKVKIEVYKPQKPVLFASNTKKAAKKTS